MLFFRGQYWYERTFLGIKKHSSFLSHSYHVVLNLNHDLFVFNPEASKMLLFLSAEEYAKEGYAIFVHLTWLLQITYSTYVVFGLLR